MNDNLKFVFITLCFAVSVFSRSRLLKSAMFLTVASDFMILIIGNYIIGVAVFCFAHVFHFIRNKGGGKKLFIYAVFAIAAVIVYLFGKDFIVSVSVLYACCLLSSVVSSFLSEFGSKRKLIIEIAFVLFLFCDVCVMFYNLPNIGRISVFAGKMIWVFYAPSQLMLAASGLSEK